MCITGKTLTVSEVETNSKLPTIKGFQHKVKVNPNVHPVQQKLRRLPLTVRSKVSQKLEELESQGVIEKIDVSEWVSPIVVRPGTYMLADGKIFNQSKLSPVKVDQEQIEVQEKETPVAKSTTAAQNSSEYPVIRKGARVRKPSVWLKDYK